MNVMPWAVVRSCVVGATLAALSGKILSFCDDSDLRKWNTTSRPLAHYLYRGLLHLQVGILQ